MSCCPAERRRSTPAPKEEEKVNEEQWPLREVVFVEDVKNVPVGKVGGARGPPDPLCAAGMRTSPGPPPCVLSETDVDADAYIATVLT